MKKILLPFFATRHQSPALSPAQADATLLPQAPQYSRKGACDIFTFTLCMLPSANEKHDRSQRVRPWYRHRELTEIARITRQREYAGWPDPQETDRYAIIYRFSFQSELREDIHNTLKPTCDLLGKGRYETVGSGKSQQKVFVPHAALIYNDNRVLAEFLCKQIVPKQQEKWATITLLRVQAQKRTQETLALLFPELLTALLQLKMLHKS